MYADNAWAAGMPSRFRVTLIRSDNPAGKRSAHERYAHRTLSKLVVEDFDVAILPNADYWWTFTDTDTMAKAAGRSRASDYRVWHTLAGG